MSHRISVNDSLFLSPALKPTASGRCPRSAQSRSLVGTNVVIVLGSKHVSAGKTLQVFGNIIVAPFTLHLVDPQKELRSEACSKSYRTLTCGCIPQGSWVLWLCRGLHTALDMASHSIETYTRVPISVSLRR